MSAMCEICKCSTYFNETLNDYACESGCACCNDPSYISDEQALTNLTEKIGEMVKELNKRAFILSEITPNDLFEQGEISGKIEVIQEITEQLETLLKEAN